MYTRYAPSLNGSCFCHNTAAGWTEGVSFLGDHTSEIICPQNRENPLCVLPYLPTLRPVSAVYEVKVQKYFISTVVCKCANHSFGLNYSLWLLQNSMMVLIKHNVCILSVACPCVVLYMKVSAVHIKFPHVTIPQGSLCFHLL